MQLGLDFVRRHSRVSARGVLLLLAGGAFAGVAAQQLHEANTTLGVLERRLDGASRAASRTADKPVDMAQLRARIALANQVLARKTLPWDELFRDIEASAEANVGLLSIQPEVATRQVRIGGEARDAATLTKYIGRLEAKPSLQNVYLVAHEMREAYGRKILRFELSASWQGALL